MGKRAGIIFLAFFTLIAISELGLLAGIYAIPSSKRVEVLNVFPKAYWIFHFSQLVVAGLYILGYFLGFRDKIMAGIVASFIVFRLLSIASILNIKTVLTWREIIQVLVFYVSGMATYYHLEGDRE
ncbi:hypothetical protein [Thermococcus waiotapuensis]|uniref:DUF4345 domain-containing protein n=1 Tax=Thermococcus waiotapuensis TaxID=90909 RepID=A0AAE4NUC7_9EURY|nr:hypothetical protein [Thermococcus waiotapuensis]MDV3104518.1 hypothetical protein [Thermococcus waiotapuensis]